MPMTFFMTRAMAKRTRAGFRETQKTLGELNGIIEETITGERTVKAFVREQVRPWRSSPASTATCKKSRSGRASWPALWAR
jgi:ABC-type multidrug transport system fused ATPase/permease subunit